MVVFILLSYKNVCTFFIRVKFMFQQQKNEDCQYKQSSLFNLVFQSLIFPKV